ncbi:proline--tRNA ligase [Nanoarchaeota archaeon]
MEDEKDTKGLTVKKEEDVSKWYTEVIQKADLMAYTDVSGCIIFKPHSYAMWEIIQREVDNRLKALGVQNAYFPLFIPESHLSKEADHVEGFAPEVAWVTHAGETKLDERLAVRPTSETIMYPAYSEWIRSWRDLPLRLNQWNNVIRWEFKHAVPFLRTREFLWNEGHTVFATQAEAEAEREPIINMYLEVLKDFMAIYGSPGIKSEKEKFAGAVYTCSIESFLPIGKAIQGPDFHHDGQNFAKAYDIKFMDPDDKEQYAWQNTWAITTRMIGVMVMMHGDNKGLVLPPPIAPIQAVIVPILKTGDNKDVLDRADKIKELLSEEYRVHLDDRENYTPGWKFNEWEMKGVPLRIEIGPKDLAADQAVLVRRDNREKNFVKTDDIVETTKVILDDIHRMLYKQSEENFQNAIVDVTNMDELKQAISEKKMVLVPYCNDGECEESIKEETGGAKTLNSPFDKPVQEGAKCIRCGKDAKMNIYVAKSY